MARSVTVGLNGSPESLAAAHWAAEEALRRKLPLCLVYAWSWLPPEAAESASQGPHWPARMLGDTAAELAARHPGVAVETRQMERLPADALLSLADSAEVMVLGSRALGAVGGFVSGSVALRVVAEAACPVVLVRQNVPGVGRPPGGAQAAEVVLGLDPHEPCDVLLEFAFATAARLGTRLRVVHVDRRSPAHAYGGLSQDAGTHDLPQTLSDLVEPWHVKYPEVAIEERILHGHPADSLVREAPGAALLVVGRYDRRRFTRIGHVAHAAVHHAMCPVAIVPIAHADAEDEE